MKRFGSNSGQNVSDHFVGINKTIPLPKGAEKEIDSLMISWCLTFIKL